MKITSTPVYSTQKLSFKIDRAIKVFHDKQILKQICDHKATTTRDSSRDSAHRT
jgi:hypothetical protein